MRWYFPMAMKELFSVLELQFYTRRCLKDGLGKIWQLTLGAELKCIIIATKYVVRHICPG